MKDKAEKRGSAAREFSRFARAYDQYNIIQAEVAKRLVSKVPHRAYGTIIDIGAGSGKVYENLRAQGISFTRFIALDASSEMLEVHAQEACVEKVCADFNEKEAFSSLPRSKETLLLSSSALQWSRDLDFTFGQLSALAPQAYFAIFTANTFRTLHEVAGVHSPIHTKEALQKAIGGHYDAAYELHRYKLHFDSVREMFRYIKKSGVSGGEKKLGYRETRALMKSYRLDYLEFEVLFVEARPR